MNLEYDTPQEVTEKQYNAVMSKLSGICAGQIQDGKYYIKLWLTKYRKYVLQIITEN